MIINDDVELAHKARADGVHLGQSDGNIIEARKLLGEDKIIGLSIDSIDQLYIANNLPVDYFGISAIFPTKNKADVTNIWGCWNLQKASFIATKPVIAIGGIDQSNFKSVMRSGAFGIAAIGAFHDASNPSQIVSDLKNSMRN